MCTAYRNKKRSWKIVVVERQYRPINVFPPQIFGTAFAFEDYFVSNTVTPQITIQKWHAAQNPSGGD